MTGYFSSLRKTVTVIGALGALLLLDGGVVVPQKSNLAADRLDQLWLTSQQPNHKPQQSTLTDTTVVDLQRGQCYGRCPAYEVKINGSGRVEFHGVAFVCEKNPPQTKIDPLLVQQLIDGLNNISFFNIPNYTSYDVTDNPFASITLNMDGPSHKVEHYFGDRKAPRLLNMIEERIDEIAGTSKWIYGCNEVKR